jgi:hypothetical protein
MFQFIQSCGCINPFYAVTEEQLRSVNYSVCGNLTAVSSDDGDLKVSEEWKLFSDIYCLIITALPGTCSKQCPYPCTERDYSIATTASGPWPHPAYQLSFYANFIQSSVFADRFEEYESVVVALQDNVITTVSTV